MCHPAKHPGKCAQEFFSGHIMGMGSSFGGQAAAKPDLRELNLNRDVSSVSNLEIPESKTETG